MSSKYTIVFLWVVCLCCEVVMTGGKVVWVKRNVTDSFRVGKDGCTNDTNVCANVSATCQPDGSCLCDSTSPNYRNPVIEFNNFVNGDSYGCINNTLIRYGVGNVGNHCDFGPFQVIPYNHNDCATNFRFGGNDTLQKCVMENVLVKYPNNSTEMELEYLNESYVNLNISNNTLYFKWKRSVPELQGTIITLILNCTSNKSILRKKKCLRAKILGKWPADNTSTKNESFTCDFTPVTTIATTSPTASPTTSPTTSAGSTSLPDEISSDDDDFDTNIIIIAAVAAAAVLIIFILVCCLCKRKRRRRQRNRESPSKKNEMPSMKRLRHTESNMRGPLAYDDEEPGKDTTLTFGGRSNPGGPSDSQKKTVTPKPSYDNTDLENDESDKVNFYSDPDYEQEEEKINKTNDATRTFQPQPEYAKVDKRKDANGANSYPDNSYDTPDYKKKDTDGENAFPVDHNYESVDVKKKNEDKFQSSDYDYAAVDIKGKDVDDSNTYTDPSYDMPVYKKNEVDSKASVDDNYESVDVNTKKGNEENFYQDCSYESIDEAKDRDRKSRKINATTTKPDSEYENADVSAKEINRAKSDAIYTKPNKDNARHLSLDAKHIEVNGDTYALPNKKK